MQQVVQHGIYGEITYWESAWTGKKKLLINGKELTKVDRSHFQLQTVAGQPPLLVSVKGSFVGGVVLKIGNEEIRVVPKMKWYEAIFPILSFLFIVIWGNVPALVAIFPVVSGFIGCFISAMFALVGLIVTKEIKKPALKLLIGFVFFLATIAVCYALALIIIVFAAVAR